jgi:phage terminase large subunit-like protein|nr:MAG TPA: Large Terminase [Caudoviricetes sp.]
MSDVSTKEYKQQRVDDLLAIEIERFQLDAIDMRLWSYISQVRNEPEKHNLYEILAILKFLRLMDTYVFRPSKVKKFTKLYESLKFSGMDGRRCYKLTSIQYFQFASILGFYKWEDVGKAEGMPDEEKKTKKIMDGRRYELRRLVREAILFVPRKFSKTTSTASLAVNEMLFGDTNAQAYTAANSYKQAKICFEEISKIVKQLDPGKKYFKATRETLHWKPNKFGRESFVECLTGGGDTKDGLNASLVIFDEYAQAKYVRDHSDGAELLQVLTSSMGVRREPLTVIITTASRVEDGPFTIELENAKKVLEGEYDDDSQFASIFQPDAWEMTDEAMGNPEIWRKCNPHIGVTVQEGYYKQRWDKAQRDAEAMIEFKTKLLNIFVSGGVKNWIPQTLARSLMTDFDIENIQGRPETMAAMDLSVSDDFSVVVYNIYSRAQRKFYLWTDCYIPEETLENHPNKELYKYWRDGGYLKVCPGAVISETMIVEDILRRNKKLLICQIGYDAYKSQEVVNALASAIASTGTLPGNILRAVPQTYGAFTSPVETFEMAAKSRPPKVALANNPILPYCFGNCYLDEDRMCNKKPLKRKENLKIDAAIASLMTFWLYNNYEH